MSVPGFDLKRLPKFCILIGFLSAVVPSAETSGVRYVTHAGRHEHFSQENKNYNK